MSESMHFKSPEHALRAAYFILATRIEPKTALLKIIEQMEIMAGIRIESKTEMTPHDWHAQAVWIVQLAERVTGTKIGFHVLQAMHGDIMQPQVRESLMQVSQWVNPATESRERLMVDLVVTHILRGRPTQQFIADQFGVAQKSISRLAKKYRDMLQIERDHVDAILWDEFKEAMIINEDKEQSIQSS